MTGISNRHGKLFDGAFLPYLAARRASPTERIYVSGTVHENIRNKLPVSFEDLGEQSVKNIAEPVRVFLVLLNGAWALAACEPISDTYGYFRYPPKSAIAANRTCKLIFAV